MSRGHHGPEHDPPASRAGRVSGADRGIAHRPSRSGFRAPAPQPASKPMSKRMSGADNPGAAQRSRQARDESRQRPDPAEHPDPAERPDLPDGPRTVLSRFTMPADDWARDDAGRGPRTVDALMSALLATLVVVAGMAVFWYRGDAGAGVALPAILAALAVAVVLVLVAMRKVRRDLHQPLSELYAWALGMCTGNFSTRVPAEGEGAYRKLAFHINRLSEALERLANDMDDVVWRQTGRLREKNASLELLYEVAASIHRLDSTDEILRVSSRSLMEMVEARGAMVCLRDADGGTSVAARIGECPDELGTGETSETGSGMVAVPLEHRGVELGVIRLFIGTSGRVESRERHRLLLSVGRHLGMCIAKARTDEESKTLSIVRERAAIAYELHDSLAQTLASLRLQADMLADSLAGAGRAPAELARIRTTLESANVELRELIAGFRAPVDGRDLRTALEEISARYTAQGAMTVHLQIDGALPELPAGSRLHVVRIVGEALANACAHSGGRLARVLVRSEAASVRVLVEDDGEGFSMPPCGHAPGEHIGLSVMRERARWLGGTLDVESEPGEGTRVSLIFPAAPGDR